MKTVYFRADGNSKIGLGHVTRCLALADMLTGYFQGAFLVQNPTDELAAQIREHHTLISLPETSDYLAEAREVSQKYLSADNTVVLDGYEFRTEYQRIIQSSGTKLVCIDDLYAWHFVADAVINQAGGIEATEYSRESYTKLYLGPAYALLRQPFLAAARRRLPLTDRDGLFVCFGGADPENLTSRVVKAAVKANWTGKIIAVTGSASARGKELASLRQTVPALEVHSSVDAAKMVSLMQQCVVAVAPASGISYEISSVGMYFITGHYVDNQKYLYRFLVENNLALGADVFQEEKLIELLSEDRWSEPGIFEKQEKWFAGNSFRHLRGVFIRLALQVRRATIGDMRTYFDWANELETRKNSLNQSPISWSRHRAWFTDRIADPGFAFYLFCLNDISVGQVRFGLVGGEATVSYSVDARYRGLGLGREMLSQAVARLVEETDAVNVKGVVKDDNPASLATFEKIGFRPVHSANGITEFELTL
ncbi:UDP-2,4-diacetamido-2,4,6-trideoxy-beta-L-altropyranose hydrolase [Persicitalea sp.]|uniref:UDP-2,4-diacetamido-2,4, 6-trideoxy-beta-L-altropyranose hydrolase n=1 Tax=Persicitalea sp. TaxID=3100273 RepID=UPI0035944704